MGFLGTVEGIEANSIKSVPIDLDGLTLRVLHPVECLKTRIHNLVELYPKLYRDGHERIEVEQLRVAAGLEIVRRYFMECLSGEGVENDSRITAQIADVCRYGQTVKCRKLLRQHRISIADAIPEGFIDKRFKAHQYQSLLDLHSAVLGTPYTPSN